MKKIILSGFALLAFSAAIAQSNQATLSQVGSYQTSRQTQSGSALKSTVTQGSGSDATLNTYNQSTTDQSGKSHTATVMQDGTANYNQAVVKQIGGGPNAADGNKATVEQKTTSGGTGGLRSATFGADATAGKGNYANIDQSQTQNEGIITQSNNSSSNFGQIVQTGKNGSIAGGALAATRIDQVNNSTGNAASIQQAGDKNAAQIAQKDFSVENQARLVQGGESNKGTIEQNTNSGGTGKGNVADLLQLGSGNSDASIIQNSDSYSNQAYLNQYGNNNQETRITQSNTSYNNRARIDQGGDGRGRFPTARVGDIYDAYTPVNNGKAIIEQSNDSHDNEARIGQSGNGHDAQIYQSGTVSFSKAFIDQFPAADGQNIGLIKQTNGTNNEARILQNQSSYPGAAGSGNNLAEVYQGGEGALSSGNVTTVVQENANNKSYNEQFGTDNVMDIKQSGNGNLVTGPSGVYADGIAHQEGIGNKAFITQTANGGVANVSSLYQNGMNNTATITQSGVATN